MRVTITGKDQVIQDMEEVERLIEEAKKNSLPHSNRNKN